MWGSSARCVLSVNSSAVSVSPCTTFSLHTYKYAHSNHVKLKLSKVIVLFSKYTYCFLYHTLLRDHSYKNPQ